MFLLTGNSFSLRKYLPPSKVKRYVTVTSPLFECHAMCLSEITQIMITIRDERQVQIKENGALRGDAKKVLNSFIPEEKKHSVARVFPKTTPTWVHGLKLTFFFVKG